LPEHADAGIPKEIAMPIRSLPERPSLEHLKKQAKRLLEAHRTGDAEAVKRVADAHPRARDPIVLADAQLVVAREYGFTSWPALVFYLSLDTEARRLRDVDLLFQNLPDARTATRGLREVLEREVTALCEAHRAGNPAVVPVIRTGRWQRGRPTDPADAIMGAELTLDEARHAIARWHDFQTWDAVLARGDEPVDPVFEAAADAIVDGDTEVLRSLIAARPALVRARSAFAHRATLLHYVAANGVENSRQWQSPPDAVEIATILLRAGAEPDATCELYGGGSTTLTLVVSSVHPARAGVQVGLVETLIDFGAAVDGVDGHGAPLVTALLFGYDRAAAALARRGARIDTLFAAAGLGRLALVRGFFDEHGHVKPGMRLQPLYGIVADTPQAQAEQALVIACKHRRLEVVEFLLQQQLDKAARDSQGMTGLHLAAWHGHIDLLELLLAHGAPLEVKNEYGGTVLDMTVWAARNAPVRGVDYPAVIERLLAAGADPSVVSLPTGIAMIDALLRRAASPSA
jgi:ankyrin repeat protein